VSAPAAAHWNVREPIHTLSEEAAAAGPRTDTAALRIRESPLTDSNNRTLPKLLAKGARQNSSNKLINGFRGMFIVSFHS
jgi:hypothetical protein